MAPGIVVQACSWLPILPESVALVGLFAFHGAMQFAVCASYRHWPCGCCAAQIWLLLFGYSVWSAIAAWPMFKLQRFSRRGKHARRRVAGHGSRAFALLWLSVDEDRAALGCGNEFRLWRPAVLRVHRLEGSGSLAATRPSVSRTSSGFPAHRG